MEWSSNIIHVIPVSWLALRLQQCRLTIGQSSSILLLSENPNTIGLASALTMRWRCLSRPRSRRFGQDPRLPTGYFDQAGKTSLMSRLVLHRRNGFWHVDRISPCLCITITGDRMCGSISRKKASVISL